MTSLLTACQDGNLSKVQKLLSKGVDIHDRNEYGDTPILLASRNGHLSIVELLVSKGANVHDKDQYGNTPISAASDQWNSNTPSLILLIQLLLSHGAMYTEIRMPFIRAVGIKSIVRNWPFFMLMFSIQSARIDLDSETVEMLQYMM
jgi:ankyrin repeat protein